MTIGLDVFKGDGFSLIELTNAINVIPNTYGRTRELFVTRTISTIDFELEYKNGILNLIPSTARYSPGIAHKRGKRELRKFSTAHFALEEEITGQDVQGKRAFGQKSVAQQLQEFVNEQMADMKRKHFITRENLRMGALKGIVKDADGSTLLDIFTEFGVVEKVFDLTLGSVGLKAKVTDVVRYFEDNLTGETMDHVRALCGPTFWDKLMAHTDVIEYLKNRFSSSDLLGRDLRKGFEFHGVVFEEYRGQASVLNEDGTTTTTPFVPVGDCRFYVEGSQQVYQIYNAPADYLETANTPGLELYAKIGDMDKFGKALPLETQMNPMPMVSRPALIARGFSSD